MAVVGNRDDRRIAWFYATTGPIYIGTATTGYYCLYVERRGTDVVEHEIVACQRVDENVAKVMTQGVELDFGLVFSDGNLFQDGLFTLFVAGTESCCHKQHEWQCEICYLIHFSWAKWIPSGLMVMRRRR